MKFGKHIYKLDCKSEVMKECKDKIYDSFKLYDTGTWLKLKRLLFGKFYRNDGGRKERSKTKICELALKILTFGKKVNAMNKVCIKSLFLPSTRDTNFLSITWYYKIKFTKGVESKLDFFNLDFSI